MDVHKRVAKFGSAEARGLEGMADPPSLTRATMLNLVAGGKMVGYAGGSSKKMDSVVPPLKVILGLQQITITRFDLVSMTCY